MTTRSSRRRGGFFWPFGAGRVAAISLHCDAAVRRLLPQGSGSRFVDAHMRRLIAIAITAAAALVAAPAALAAPAGTLSAQKTTWKWTGTAYGTNLVGEPCNTDHSCEDFLLQVKDPGSLNLAWKGTAPAGPAWLGVTVYLSDAKGTVENEDEPFADGGGLQDDGATGAFADPGFYVVRVSGLLTSLATYEVTATLEPDA